MLQMRSTPHGAGLEVAGTSDDFTALYNAVHTMVNQIDQKKGQPLETDRGNHMLSLAYDLRKAMPISFPRTTLYRPGMDKVPSKDPRSFMKVEDQWFDLDTGDRLHFFRLWPHVIGDLAALHRYIGTWVDRLQKNRKGEDYTVSWAQLVLYRNLVQETLLEIIPENRRSSTRKEMQEKEYAPTFSPQWIEYLTMKFIKLDGEGKNKGLPKMVGNIFHPGNEYYQLSETLKAESLRQGCRPEELEFEYDIPDWGEW